MKTKFLRKKNRKIKSEINITPLTDVSLMLLSIFMLTTPLLVQSGLNIELPRVKNVEKANTPSNIEVLIDKNGDIFIGKNKFDIPSFETELKNKLKNADGSVIIKADKNVRYEIIMKVIDISKKNGVKKIALGIETELEP
ncbi:MAG: ExbD/TolR family protein [Brevinematia bacterium]